jgi:hypothetical protein
MSRDPRPEVAAEQSRTEKGLPAPDPQEKVLLITPGIETLEKLLMEFGMWSDDTHPDIVRVKQEQAEIEERRLAQIEEFRASQVLFLEQECRCEVAALEAMREEFNISQESPGAPA